MVCILELRRFQPLEESRNMGKSEQSNSATDASTELLKAIIGCAGPVLAASISAIALLIIAGQFPNPLVPAKPTSTLTATLVTSGTPTQILMSSVTPNVVEPTVPAANPTNTPILKPKRLDTDSSYHILSITDLVSGTPSALPLAQEGTNTIDIRSAVWSTDGKSVLFSWAWQSSNGLQASGLQVVNEQGKRERDIVVWPSPSVVTTFTYQDAIWSPDGGVIALVFKPDDPNRCAFVVQMNGTGLRRINKCERDDRPRFWSTDGKWIGVVSEGSKTLFALEVDGNQRIPLDQLRGVKFYDERYFPWRILDRPKCSNNWTTVFEIFWYCE